MIPDRYDLKNHTTDDDGGGVRDESIYQGDSYTGPLFILPRDVSDYDGPADISDATFTAQIRRLDGTLEGAFAVAIEDIEAETVSVRPSMTPAVTTDLTPSSASLKMEYDLQAAKTGWVGTFVWGRVVILKERTY